VSLRRLAGAASALVFALTVVAFAEVGLVALLVVFSYALKIRLIIATGSAGILFSPDPLARVEVRLFGAAIVASMLGVFACGLISAGWRFRFWRPRR